MRRLMYIVTLIVFFAVIGSVFNTRAHATGLTYYQNGKSERLSDEKMPEVLTIIDELVNNIDDALKLIVTDEEIDEVKHGKCLEIILSDKREVQPNDFIRQGFTYHKLLLPFFDAEGALSATLYFGNQKVYYTPPYINRNGRKYADEIRKIIGK